MQQETRLKNLFYALFGGTAFFLLVLFAGYFFIPNFYPKTRDAITAADAKYTAERTVADQLDAEQKKYVKAQVDQEAVKAQLVYFRNRYEALTIGNIDPASDPSQVETQNFRLFKAFDGWMDEYRGSPSKGIKGYGEVLQDELDYAIDASGVAYSGATTGGAGGSPSGGDTRSRDTAGGGASTSGEASRPSIAIPRELAPKNPEDLRQQGFIPANGLLVPVARIDSMAVRGDLGNILRFFQIITSNRSRILKTVSGVNLSGNSPDIIATFSLTPYLVVRGEGAKITATYGGGGGAAAVPGVAASGVAPVGSAANGATP